MTLANKYKPGFSERPPSDEQARLRRLCEMTWEVKTLLAKFKWAMSVEPEYRF